MKMKHLVILVLIVLTVQRITAQNDSGKNDIPFNGRIIDNNNFGLKKINVSLMPSGTKTKTDKNGYFAFLNVSDKDTLLISDKNWKYAIPVGVKKSMKILVLNNGVETNEDNELINIGFGNVSKANRTNSASTINGDEIRSKGLTDIYKILQMYVPGVLVISFDDGHKGVTLRGGPTLNEMGEALYLVDGVKIERLDYINVWNIEKIDVIKDGNIYGMEGANGVILITNRSK